MAKQPQVSKRVRSWSSYSSTSTTSSSRPRFASRWPFNFLFSRPSTQLTSSQSVSDHAAIDVSNSSQQQHFGHEAIRQLDKGQPSLGRPDQLRSSRSSFGSKNLKVGSQVIELDDDSSLDENINQNREVKVVLRNNRYQAHSPSSRQGRNVANVIDVEDYISRGHRVDETNHSEKLCEARANFQQNEKSLKQSRLFQSSLTPFNELEKAALPLSLLKIDRWTREQTALNQDFQASIGDQVELKCGDFLDIKRILRDPHSEKRYLVGELFRPMSAVGDMLDDNESELCLIHYLVDDIDSSSPNPFRMVISSTQALRLVHIRRVSCGLREERSASQMREDVNVSATYTCHIKRVTHYHAGDVRRAPRHKECAFVQLSKADAQGSAWILKDAEARQRFRGQTAKGGSAAEYSLEEKDRFERECELDRQANRELGGANTRAPWAREKRHRDYAEISPNVRNKKVRELIHTPHISQNRKIWEHCMANKVSQYRVSKRRYTFGDAFCGAGGMSRGAVEAGLKLQWAFDHDPGACRTYRTNFPWVLLKQVSAHTFATAQDRACKVDILHMSPPCQFFSPAHTRSGKDDEKNVAASFATDQLLDYIKPRIFTLEQTLGMSRQEQHRPFFHAVIRQALSRGYSVRWKICDLNKWGVPQSRKRLIMLGSCPGEELPTFPAETHNGPQESDPSRYECCCINDAIEHTIPRGWPRHNVTAALKASFDKHYPPRDGNTELAGTLTCSDQAKTFHPSGKRKYTLAEQAALQTFPVWHEFDKSSSDTEVRRQIGNAVPPIFGKRLYEHLIKWLSKRDQGSLENWILVE